MKRDEVLKSIYGDAQWKSIKDEFVKEAKKAKTLKKQSEFLAKYMPYFYYDTPFNTLKNRSLTMRKALISEGIDENSPLIEAFKIPTAMFKAFNEKANNDTIEKIEKHENKDIDYLALIPKIIERLKHNIENNVILAKSNNVNEDRELAYQKVILLALATGRRQFEIMKNLEIQKKKDYAVYKNLAKKKKDDKNEVTAPILTDIFFAKKCLNDIREVFDTKNMTSKEINSKYNNVIKNALNRYVPELADFGFHFLRTCYAEYCFLKFANEEEKKDKNMYFSKILGHELKANSAHHYQAKV